MVFNRVFFFIYNFIGLRARPRLKHATPLPHNDHGGASSFKQRVMEFQTADCLSLSRPGKTFEGEMCCVCLSSMEEEEGKWTETSVLPCLHEFHKVCVDRWFEERRRRTCPVCRFSMDGGGIHGHETEILTEEMVIWFSSFHASGF